MSCNMEYIKIGIKLSKFTEMSDDTLWKSEKLFATLQFTKQFLL